MLVLPRIRITTSSVSSPETEQPSVCQISVTWKSDDTPTRFVCDPLAEDSPFERPLLFWTWLTFILLVHALDYTHRLAHFSSILSSIAKRNTPLYNKDGQAEEFLFTVAGRNRTDLKHSPCRLLIVECNRMPQG